MKSLLVELRIRLNMQFIGDCSLCDSLVNWTCDEDKPLNYNGHYFCYECRDRKTDIMACVLGAKPDQDIVELENWLDDETTIKDSWS